MEQLLRKAAAAAAHSPEKAATILTDWLSKPASSFKNKKQRTKKSA